MVRRHAQGGARPLITTIGGLDIRYDGSVLEPRPWTAEQSHWAAEVARSVPAGRVLELCSGAGHIGLLTAALTRRDVVLVDVSAAACCFAETNARQVRAQGIDVDVRNGCMTEVLSDEARFPLILADPPYIPSKDVHGFPQDPGPAIDGGQDGLSVARHCLATGARHLGPDGAMVLQVRDTEQASDLDPAAVHAGLRVQEVRSVGGHGALVLLRAAG